MSRRWHGQSRRGPIPGSPPAELADPDPAWRHAAGEAIHELWRLLEPWRDGGVHHVGSTAVPDVPAEPVVDLFAGLADADDAPAAGAALQAAGWQPVHADDSDAVLSGSGPRYTAVRGDGATVAVELLVPGTDRWDTAILFRDRLRADGEHRREYARIKRRAVDRATTRQEYERRKAAFIRRVVEAA